MDAADREKERLRKLAELYDRKDLDDVEYRQEYEKIAAEYQDKNDQTATVAVLDPEEIKEKVIEKRTTLDEPVAQQAAQSSPVTSPGTEYLKPQGSMEAPSVMSRPESDPSRDTFSSSANLHHVRPTVAMKRVGGGVKQFVFIPIVMSLGIGAALAIGTVSRGKVTKKPEVKQEVNVVNQQEVVKSSVKEFIAPRFGPDAVEACRSKCSRWNGPENRVCLRGCGRRSLEMYGRRITLVELKPKAEVDELVENCLARDFKLDRAENEQIWRASLMPFVSGLREGGELKGGHHSRELYKKLFSAQKKAKFPPEGNFAKEDDLTEKILSAACLVAHDALTLWAFETVERQDDEFSAAFYAELRKELTAPKFSKVSEIQDEVDSLWGEFSP